MHIVNDSNITAAVYIHIHDQNQRYFSLIYN